MSVLGGKYEILESLHTDEFQSVFVCKLLESEDKRFIVNEIRQADIIAEVKDGFIYNKDIIKLEDAFEIEDKFYAAFSLPKGTALDEYIEKHNLTIADKMYFTDGILKKFIEIDRLNYSIQYVLCNLNNISVQSRRFLHFNNIYIFSRDKLNVGSKDIIKKLGHLLLCVFANKENVNMATDKSNLPPAILPIVSNCIEGNYDSINKIYEDFKNTLLYATFVDTGSLDNKIRTKAVQAKKRQKVVFPPILAWLLLLAVLLGGGYWFIKNKTHIVGPSGSISIFDNKKNPPIADFTISINKIYVDDEVKFIDKSIASNPGDEIKNRLWTIEKDGNVIMNSNEDTIVYNFNDVGEYRISLIAQDSRGVNSKPYSHSISVLEKPEHSGDFDDKEDNSFDRK